MCAVTKSDVRYFIQKLERQLEFEPGTLFGGVRKQEFSQYRFGLYKLLYTDSRIGWTLVNIGELFNQRDHSTIIHGLAQITDADDWWSLKLRYNYEWIKIEFNKFYNQLVSQEVGV